MTMEAYKIMKITEMTAEQKTRVLAELDDDKPALIFDYTGKFTLDYFVNGEQFMRRKNRYDLSYDAIIPLIQKLDDITKVRVEDYLESVMQTCFWFDATPSQLCDAVLVANGKAEL